MINSNYKKCKKCLKEKTQYNFFKSTQTKDKINIYCKLCSYEFNRNSYAKKTVMERKALNFKRNYGLSLKTFELMLEEQNNSNSL